MREIHFCILSDNHCYGKEEIASTNVLKMSSVGEGAC